MAAVSVKVTFHGDDVNKLRDMLAGAGWSRFKDSVARDLGGTVRINMVNKGKPSGDFAPLSGFDANTRAVTGKSGKTTKRTRKNKAGEKLSRHRGYARRKEMGKTPGRGKFGPRDRLRDTGELISATTGSVDGDTAFLTATGEGAGDRPSNADLLYWHATGAGDLPVRNPCDDMKNFEDRTHKRLIEHTDKALGV